MVLISDIPKFGRPAAALAAPALDVDKLPLLLQVVILSVDYLGRPGQLLVHVLLNVGQVLSRYAGVFLRNLSVSSYRFE